MSDLILSYDADAFEHLECLIGKGANAKDPAFVKQVTEGCCYDRHYNPLAFDFDDENGRRRRRIDRMAFEKLRDLGIPLLETNFQLIDLSELFLQDNLS